MKLEGLMPMLLGFFVCMTLALGAGLVWNIKQQRETEWHLESLEQRFGEIDQKWGSAAHQAMKVLEAEEAARKANTTADR